MVSRVVNDNLVRFREFGRVGECYYIVMNQVRGYSLHRLFEPIFKEGKAPPLPVAAHLGQGILNGLSALHRVRDEAGDLRPMVHRDVTPANIIVSGDGEAVLIDFGIAKDMYGPSITVPGQLIGTARYMAPEHRRAEFIDARADVFSASVILYELFTGHHPWPPQKSVRELLRTTFDPPEVPDEVRARIPEDVLDVILRGLECDADDRYPDAADMARQLASSSAYSVDEGPLTVSSWLEAMRLPLDEELSRPVLDQRRNASDDAEVIWTSTGTLSSSQPTRRSLPPAPPEPEPTSEVLSVPPLPPRRDAVLDGNTGDFASVLRRDQRRQYLYAGFTLVVAIAVLVGLYLFGS